MANHETEKEIGDALSGYLGRDNPPRHERSLKSLSTAELRVIYDYGWVAAIEGKAAMACPYFEAEQHDQFNAWMDGYHDHAAGATRSAATNRTEQRS